VLRPVGYVRHIESAEREIEVVVHSTVRKTRFRIETVTKPSGETVYVPVSVESEVKELEPLRETLTVPVPDPEGER
jgi:hypothetical protein